MCRPAAQPRAEIQRAVAHVGACLFRQIRIQRSLKIIISLKPNGARKAKYGCIADTGLFRDIHQRTLADGILILHHIPGNPLLSLRQRDTFDPINKEIVHDFPHVAGFLVFYHTKGKL